MREPIRIVEEDKEDKKDEFHPFKTYATFPDYPGEKKIPLRWSLDGYKWDEVKGADECVRRIVKRLEARREAQRIRNLPPPKPSMPFAVIKAREFIDVAKRRLSDNDERMALKSLDGLFEYLGFKGTWRPLVIKENIAAFEKLIKNAEDHYVPPLAKKRTYRRRKQVPDAPVPTPSENHVEVAQA